MSDRWRVINQDILDGALARLVRGAEGFRAAMLAASLERDHYRAALERIDQAPLGTDTYAMRVIAQQAIIAYDPEYPNNRRKP